jgi:hypothetical protein
MMKIEKTQSYMKRIDDPDLKLAVFYDRTATINGSKWSLNEFLASEKHEIKEVIFVQGFTLAQDSFHVLYKVKKQ